MLAVMAGLLLSACVAPSLADTIVVTTDSAGTGGPECTIRDAMTAANTDTATGGCPAGNGADTIELPADSTIMLTEVDNDHGELIGPNGLPSVTSVLTVNGNSSIIARSDADGTPRFRILHVAAEGDLTLNDLTLTGGLASNCLCRGSVGGGIFNYGTLALHHCTVEGNRGLSGGGISSWSYSTLNVIDSIVSENSAGFGGGIDNGGTMTLTNSTVTGNTGTNAFWMSGAGGGIYNDYTATLINSTVSGNTILDSPDGGGAGGGIYHSYASTLTLTNSTVSGNTVASSDGRGGGIYNLGDAMLTNSTITGNRATDGGGIRSIGTIPLTLANSIVANSVGSADCGGTVIDDGYNIIEDGSCLSDPTSMSGDPGLGPLDDNGGPTLTHGLLPGSIAIDAIDAPDACGADTDQRGVRRPQGVSCDIGAFERQQLGMPRRADAR